MVKIYYWPFLGRAGAAIRMLQEAGVDYELVSDMEKMAPKMAAFGGGGGTFAPPVLEDGDTSISQSAAVTMYVGKKFGFAAPDDCKALQWMEDIKDLFENGFGKNNDECAKLKAYIYGDGEKPSRFALFASCIESNVQGPFFFGEKMSYVDFYFANFLACTNCVGKIQEKTGKDVFEPYPKLQAIAKAIRGLESMKSVDLIDLPAQYGTKDEVIEGF